MKFIYDGIDVILVPKTIKEKELWGKTHRLYTHCYGLHTPHYISLYPGETKKIFLNIQIELNYEEYGVMFKAQSAPDHLLIQNTYFIGKDHPQDLYVTATNLHPYIKEEKADYFSRSQLNPKYLELLPNQNIADILINSMHVMENF